MGRVGLKGKKNIGKLKVQGRLRALIIQAHLLVRAIRKQKKLKY